VVTKTGVSGTRHRVRNLWAPLAKDNYEVPTCAYCHMDEGRHQVAHKSLWKFGLREVNPHTSANQVLRRRWVDLDLCTDCHEPEQARLWLGELDRERKAAWRKLHAAEDILRDLRADDLLHPGPGERPPYPADTLERLWPHARIGFCEGQASAFYNVSSIERDYFEMWYFASLGAYKFAAHGDTEGVAEGHTALARALESITGEARQLRVLGEKEQNRSGHRADPGDLWLAGPHTEMNRERN